MRAVFSFAKKLIILIGLLFSRQISASYLLFHPININLRNKILGVYNRKDGKKRIKEIDSIRVNNIYATFWSHAGTVLAFGLTIISIVFSITWTIYGIFGEEVKNYYLLNNKFSTFVFVMLIIDLIIVAVTPILLRRIIDSLPSDSYAKLSLSNLNQSQILTFIALKYWELCDDFVQEVKFGTEISKLESARDNEEFTDIFKEKEREKWIDLFRKFNELAVKFKANSHKKIYNAKALKLEATNKLSILSIEFSHHIMKFSPYMLEFRLNSLIHNSETLLYLLEDKDFDSDPFYYEFKEVLSEISLLIEDLASKRKDYLFQLIAYNKIHSYVIGLASATSTSKSLKIFARGLSTVIKDTSTYIKKKEREINGAFIALLHRSKAHYGFDLLISLENFYLKNFKDDKNKNKTPELLASIKKGGKKQLSLNEEHLIGNIREDLVKKYSEAMEKIGESFEKNFEIYCKNNVSGIFYILIFGYSRIVRNILLQKHSLLNKKNVKIFVIKEDNNEMLDTRLLRFELDDKKDMKIRDTFTGSDNFFKRLLKKSDSLLMIAGAEAFDKENNRLFHTNNYQKRIENLIAFLKENEKTKPQPDVWIIAGNYKIYEKFPVPKDYKFAGIKFFFGENEFFVDHYDKVDIYNFNDLGIEVKLISDE